MKNIRKRGLAIVAAVSLTGVTALGGCPTQSEAASEGTGAMQTTVEKESSLRIGNRTTTTEAAETEAGVIFSRASGTYEEAFTLHLTSD